MTKYRVIKPYADRKVGDVLDSLYFGDTVALELGGLEKVKSDVSDALAYHLSLKYNRSSIKELAIEAIDFFKSRMPKKSIEDTKSLQVRDYTIDEVNKALFGE